jgi:hypothetical protein
VTVIGLADGAPDVVEPADAELDPELEHPAATSAVIAASAVATSTERGRPTE